MKHLGIYIYIYIHIYTLFYLLCIYFISYFVLLLGGEILFAPTRELQSSSRFAGASLKEGFWKFQVGSLNLDPGYPSRSPLREERGGGFNLGFEACASSLVQPHISEGLRFISVPPVPS